MKNLLKILLIGILTTFCRVLGQVMIPSETQNVLLPSVFVVNGTMPIAFALYGIFAYSVIASLFLLVRKDITGNKVMQGVKFGISCCVIWVAYLFEPLPHVAPMDRITYPLADGITLIIMGLLLGVFFGRKSETARRERKRKYAAVPIVAITAFFLAGRLMQYLVFHIYSSFYTKTLETILWCSCTGFIVACSMAWLERHIAEENPLYRVCILGLLLFGLDLTLFNSFMLLVFKADIFDLTIRTTVDIAAVTAGCFFFKKTKAPGNTESLPFAKQGKL